MMMLMRDGEVVDWTWDGRPMMVLELTPRPVVTERPVTVAGQSGLQRTRLTARGEEVYAAG